MSVSPSADDRLCGLLTLLDELTARQGTTRGFPREDVESLAGLVGLIGMPPARAELLSEAAGEVSSAQVGAFCALLGALARRGDGLMVLGAFRRLQLRATEGECGARV